MNIKNLYFILKSFINLKKYIMEKKMYVILLWNGEKLDLLLNKEEVKKLELDFMSDKQFINLEWTVIKISFIQYFHEKRDHEKIEELRSELKKRTSKKFIKKYWMEEKERIKKLLYSE